MLWLLVLYVTMVYGPIAAYLVELFPTRIRYTSMSLPYHIGNGWFGGFLPAISFALVAGTGNLYYGLWYPIIIALMSVVIGGLFLRETRTWISPSNRWVPCSEGGRGADRGLSVYGPCPLGPHRAGRWPATS